MPKKEGLNPDFFISPEEITKKINTAYPEYENFVKNIPIELLVPHPKQAEIYGEDVIEDEFVASIKDKGILTPLTVTATDDGMFMIISGHRRKKGALLAGLPVVPCIEKTYENEIEMELEFLMYNIQREKSKETKINELYQYKQILCQIGKTRQGKGVYAETIFENEDFWRFAKTSGVFEKVKPGEPLNTVKILKDLTGFSEYEQKYLLRIKKTDWIQEEIYRLRDKLLPKHFENQIWENHAKIKQEHFEQKISTNEAIKMLNDMIASFERVLDAEKEKENKTPKLKKDKIQKQKVKKEDVPSPGLLLNIGGQTTFSETPLKFVENQSVIDYCFKADKFDFGVARTMNSIVGFAVHYENKNYLIKPEMLAKFIQKELSQNEKAN